MTSKEAAELSGKSISWLKQHECTWCDQTVLYALKYGCGAIWEKCDPVKRFISPREE
jgi:hypothetical protein